MDGYRIKYLIGFVEKPIFFSYFAKKIYMLNRLFFNNSSNTLYKWIIIVILSVN